MLILLHTVGNAEKTAIFTPRNKTDMIANRPNIGHFHHARITA
jgi:hypothetical protein